METRVIDHRQYYATKKVRLDDKVYQEYKPTSLHPGTLYFDESDKMVDEQTHIELIEKFGLKIDTQDGKMVIYD